ncbi:MAG: AMP-binding protein [Candidatus Dormibacteraeota bacterium]|uniref:AMP-binding protein n=1 Tax=Candidatus Aeolococcus gillhamiae TaxID=3127015 RepID=A0A934N4E7_9BACT|nr:AMP-binding protein [Candidatus Dormibacteraeota bacterium]
MGTVRAPQTLVSWIAAVVAARRQHPAVIEGTLSWSYTDLWSRSEQVARAVSALPTFASGTRVALIGANDPQYLAAYFGVLRAGGVVVPLNPRLANAEIANQVRFVGAIGTIVGDVDTETSDALGLAAPVWRLPELRGGRSGALPTLGPQSSACILLTSGSTGEPKGVVHSQGTLLHAALQIAAALPFSPDDRAVAFLPFFASIPELVLPTLVSGGALDIVRRFDVELIARACQRATCLDAIPTLMARLLHGGVMDDLRKLRWLMFASEAMPPPLLEQWWAELPGVATHEIYGMTELLTMTYAPPALLREAPQSVGRPFPTSAVAVVDSAGQPVPIGSSGEVICRSPARMLGYLDAPAATAAVLDRAGWMRTGDLGEFDESGRLRLTGRLKDQINSGGLKVAPGEIESVALRHPQVIAAVVVGIPDLRWGETPVVVAVRAVGSSLAAADVLAFCRRELGGFKRPSGAAVVESLPQIGIGKVAKDEIKQRVLSGELQIVRAS